MSALCEWCGAPPAFEVKAGGVWLRACSPCSTMTEPVAVAALARKNLENSSTSSPKPKE